MGGSDGRPPRSSPCASRRESGVRTTVRSRGFHPPATPVSARERDASCVRGAGGPLARDEAVERRGVLPRARSGASADLARSPTTIATESVRCFDLREQCREAPVFRRPSKGADRRLWRPNETSDPLPAGAFLQPLAQLGEPVEHNDDVVPGVFDYELAGARVHVVGKGRIAARQWPTEE